MKELSRGATALHVVGLCSCAAVQLCSGRLVVEWSRTRRNESEF